MNRSDSTTERVARWLQSAGLDGPATFLLEAAGPFLPFGAQAAFLLAPLFGTAKNSINDLAQVLEDPAKVSILVENLRAEAEK